jgi:OOP family OmpA-OmpF porin
VLKDNPTIHVEVGGHTDSIGSDAYNQKLSERRAQTVATELEHDGISASRLTVRGYGERKPEADNKTAEGRARNRRVELIVD